MFFNDKMLKAITPKSKPYVLTEKSDSRGGGRFQIKVYPTGTIAFQIQYFHDKKRRRLEIGRYGAFSLAEARKKFFELSAMVEQGDDVAVQKRAEESVKVNAESQVSMKHLVDEYLIHAEKTLKSALAIRRVFDCDLYPFLIPDETPQEFIEREGPRELIYKVWNRGAKRKADLFKYNMLALFRYSIDFDNSPEQFKKPNRYNVKYNPCRDIKTTYTPNPGQRWLTEKDINAIWYSNQQPKTLLFFRLNLALGGQRVFEILHSNIKDYDFEEKLLTIPIERLKVSKRGPHIVPLSDLAVEILNELMPYRSPNGDLFPGTANKKHMHLQALIAAFTKAASENNVERFTPRDLRRTCKTLMGKAGIPKEHRDILQQHVKGDVSTNHYDRYDYLKEKREAIDIWEEYLKRVIKR